MHSISRKLVYNSMNVLSEHALIGAYSQTGDEWVSELCEVLTGNVDFAWNFIRDHLEGVEVMKPEGTYMMFLDCGAWLERHGKTMDELLRRGWDYGIGWQDGRRFHGPTHIRINLASPLTRIEEAFRRMDQYVFHGEW